uniref:Uncharacterized protein n=1 Tax=Ascaris lumbricoides TaxID=6252 RepID=A0A0M3IJB5_ASCLU
MREKQIGRDRKVARSRPVKAKIQDDQSRGRSKRGKIRIGKDRKVARSKSGKAEIDEDQSRGRSK